MVSIREDAWERGTAAFLPVPLPLPASKQKCRQGRGGAAAQGALGSEPGRVRWVASDAVASGGAAAEGRTSYWIPGRPLQIQLLRLWEARAEGSC